MRITGGLLMYHGDSAHALRGAAEMPPGRAIVRYKPAIAARRFFMRHLGLKTRHPASLLTAGSISRGHGLSTILMQWSCFSRKIL